MISETRTDVRIDSRDGRVGTEQEAESVQYSAAASGKLLIIA